MPNNRWNKMKSKGGAPAGQGGGSVPSWKDKTASWPGVPGKTQPKDRSWGTKKIKQSMRSEGI